MKISILRSAAVAFGICTCGIAQAQYGEQASSPAYGTAGYGTPAYGTAYGTAASAGYPQSQARTAARFGAPYRPVSDTQGGPPAEVGSGASPHAPLPPPQSLPHPQPDYPSAPPIDPHAASMAADGNCSNCQVGQIYNEAAAAPWIGSAPVSGHGHGAIGAIDGPAMPIRNWFAGSSLLFLDYENDTNRALVIRDAMPSDIMLQTDQVAPGSTTGFETFVGRYFAGGKYALSGSYFYFNPDEESVTAVPAAAGDYRMTVRNWDRMDIDMDMDGNPDNLGDPGTNADDHLYGALDGASAYRIRRDVAFQGIELNLLCFGIGGASRAGFGDACGGGCGPDGGCGIAACGGMCSPLLPACNSRMQFLMSHGMRWFQFRDNFELGSSMLANGYGSGDDDFYNNIDVENNLYGYQFGAKSIYCISRRVNVYAGGKFGVYGNNVDYRNRIGTRGAAAQVNAYYPDMDDEYVDVCRNETVLSSLGELDLGMGVRLTNCWTLTGGYRLMGLTGVATSVGNISNDPANLHDGHLLNLNDSVLLQGGYVGVQYNW